MATVTISTIKHIKHLDGPVDGANNESTTHVKNALLYFDHGAQAAGERVTGASSRSTDVTASRAPPQGRSRFGDE